MIQQYKSAKKGRLDTKIVGRPYAFKPNPNSKDYNRGYIVRYFSQKVNDNFAPITEISKSGFNQLKSNPLYRCISLRWRISGTKEEIKSSNRISISEKLKLMSQIKNRLVNLIEYCNEFKTT